MASTILNEEKKTSDKRLEYNREWSKRNRAKRNLYRARWMEKYPEKAAIVIQKTKERTRLYREQNRDLVKAQARMRYLEHRAERLLSQAKYRTENPLLVAISKRKYFFGSSAEAYYQEQLKKQAGKCAICERTGQETGRSLGLDHSHDFSAKDKRGWRGLLCKGCNAGLGNFRECELYLGGRALEYLVFWNNQRTLNAI